MNRSTLAVLSLVLVVAGVAVASSPATQLCGVCGVEGAHHPSAGIGDPVLENVTYGDSSLAVQVHANGSSTWTERVQLDPGSADRLDANPALRRRFVEQRHGRFVINDPGTFETAVRGRMLVVRYRVENSAQSGLGGVLLFEQFHDVGTRYRADADRVVIRGPPGTTVVNEPPTGTVRNGSVIYGSGDRSAPTDETYITFAETDGPVTDYAAGITMALDVGPTMVGQVLPYGAVLAFVWASAALGLSSYLRSESGEPASETATASEGATQTAPNTVSKALQLGIALLVAIPVVVVLGFSYTATFWIPFLAMPAFWLAAGTARTPRQRWGAVGGVALTPTLLFLPMTPVSGFGGILLWFGFIAGMVWTPVGMLLCWFGTRRSPGHQQ